MMPKQVRQGPVASSIAVTRLTKLQDFAAQPTVLVAICWVVVLAVSNLMRETIATPQNLTSIVALSSTTIITGVGFTIAMVAGVFDLSVGSAMMITGVVAGTLVLMGVPVYLAMASAIVLGTAIGATNAFLVTKLRINPIIATLGMLFILKGAGQVIGGGRGTQVSDPTFRFARDDIFGLPIPVLIMAGVVVIGHYLLAYTTIGRRITAVGDNSTGAREVAIDVERYRAYALILCGTLAGLSGLLVASNLGATDAQQSIGREIDVATATFLGGAALAGGRGSVIATAIAVLLLATIYNVFIQLNVRPEYVQVVSGALLILAVAFNTRPTGGFK
jgi:ribose transport system permease protein